MESANKGQETVCASRRKKPCLLYPRKRTCAAQQLMSAKGQKRTYRVQSAADGTRLQVGQQRFIDRAQR